ncbi:MAG: type II toxin-antitoxin system HicA family toxin [Candidatus Methanoperedens sp.]|nr:type II toxin-antitoxin system HicA family toxin [Candidatus Methanoperedens sp.]MCZ7395213.1 type II toxin-antitoxin system HicA family toxin [Candidatus Methanoperedens sp.]
MGKLPVLSGREVIKALKKIGFEPARQKGCHIVLVRVVSDSKRAVVVPNHKEIDPGTLLEIIRQAGLKRDEFVKLLK